MFKTISLNENVSVGFKFILESFSERIAVFFGRNSRPILSGVVFRVVIAPTVVFFLAYLSPMVLIGLCSPSKHHLRDAGCILTFAGVESECNIAVSIFNRKAVAIFKHKERMHQSEVGIGFRFRSLATYSVLSLCTFQAERAENEIQRIEG